MIFLPVLIVCSLHVSFVGDPDSGPTCLKFVNRPEIHYDSYTTCKTRLWEIVESVKSNLDRLEIQLPGPWHFKGDCYIPTVDEKLT